MPKEIDYSTLPSHMQESTRLYIEEGRISGDFLIAVFSNQLVESFGRADTVNQFAMFNWVEFLYNQAPADCWGSYKKIQHWAGRGGLVGRKW